MDYNMFLLARAEHERRARTLAAQSQYDAMPSAPPSHRSQKLRRLLFHMGIRLIAVGNWLKSDNAPTWIESAKREPGC